MGPAPRCGLPGAQRGRDHHRPYGSLIHFLADSWLRYAEAIAHLERHLAGTAPDALLSARAGGGHLRNGHFHQLYWGPAMKGPDGRGMLRTRPVPHDLRHAHASWLLAAQNLHLTRFQTWITAAAGQIGDGGERQAFTQFATWTHLRDLRSRKEPLSTQMLANRRHELRTVIALLAWARRRGETLASLDQADLEV